MQPIHTLTVNGQTFIIQDPNAATAQQLEQAVDAAKAEMQAYVEETILGGEW